MKNLREIISKCKNLTLLYVEDDKNVCKNTYLLLSDIFCNIIVAKDGKEGLEDFKNHKIDIVLTDVNMPHMDGLEMSREIKKINEDTPIIILTAITNISTIKEALDIGVDSFINKPLTDINILLSKLNNIIQKLNYEENLKKQKELQIDKEKVDLVFSMIKNISHHWKQPLSLIATISSSISYKIENNIPITNKDFNSIETVTSKVNDLSNILEKIETLNFSDINLEEIEKIISISHPIYKD